MMENTESIGGLIYVPEKKEIFQYRKANMETFTDIKDYWMKREGLVFYPFDRARKAYFFSKEDTDNASTDFEFTPNDEVQKQDYTAGVYMAQAEMQLGEVKKVVLARNEVIKGQYSAEQSFQNAVKKFPGKYVYLVNVHEEKWVGASPELLLKYANGKVSTVALAGTKLVAETFSEKEIEEQHMVETFIEDKFSEVGLSGYTKSKREEVVFDTIKHLQTTYEAEASADEAMELLRHLQPTSAVCGLPRDKSFAFIQDYEVMNRSFYAGITGVLTQDEALFFVNLRCMRFYDNTVELFAGAGITADSNADLEWEETQRKLDTVKQVLSLG